MDVKDKWKITMMVEGGASLLWWAAETAPNTTAGATSNTAVVRRDLWYGRHLTAQCKAVGAVPYITGMLGLRHKDGVAARAGRGRGTPLHCVVGDSGTTSN